MPLVARRYAEALVEISLEHYGLDDYQQELQHISSIYSNENDFKAFLTNPEIKPFMKKDMVKKVFEGRLKPEILNFILLLIDKRRIDYLPEIVKEFMLIADENRNILNMTIISVEPLTEMQVKDITQKYMKKHKASSFKVNTVIDSSIIGGVIVKIGDVVYDGSVKGRLESLKNVIVS